jgi:IS5 family transposase
LVIVKIKSHFAGKVRTRPNDAPPHDCEIAERILNSAGGQFVAHAAALPGNPYDGHTLGTVIPQMEALIGNVLDRCITDAGYRGHNAPPDHKFKVYTTSQKRRLTPQIKREFKRRAAIEPVIGHLKEHHRMGRNHLAHASGAPSTPCSPPPVTTSDDSSRG